MSLKDIFCQDKAIGILQRAISADKLAHAYIFAGPDGVGKFKTARELGKLLLCEKPINGKDFADSCGTCESCKLFEGGAHPDFSHIHKELYEYTKKGEGKETANVELKIDVIREFLIEKVALKPTVSKRRVFVVSEMEKVNAHSQNAMLKTLEEPPSYCCIILLCTRLDELLATTKSRCQLVRFGPVAEEKIIGKLIGMGIEQKKAQYFARLSQGSLGYACRLGELEQAGAGVYEKKVELIKKTSELNYADAVAATERILALQKEIASTWLKLDTKTSKTDINRRVEKLIIQIIISSLTDAIKSAVIPKEPMINEDQKEVIRRIGERYDAEQGAEKISICYKSLRWIDASVNEKLIFEDLLLNLACSDKI